MCVLASVHGHTILYTAAKAQKTKFLFVVGISKFFYINERSGEKPSFQALQAFKTDKNYLS